MNINLMEKHILLLDRFVDKLSSSNFPERKVIEQAYLFCSGFYIKYQSEIEKISLSNSEVVLGFLLLSYYSNIYKIDDGLINKERMQKTCSSLISYIVKNSSRTESAYIHGKNEYDQSLVKKRSAMKIK